jgi:trimeric autotransporter adhesin
MSRVANRLTAFTVVAAAFSVLFSPGDANAVRPAAARGALPDLVRRNIVPRVANSRQTRVHAATADGCAAASGTGQFAGGNYESYNAASGDYSGLLSGLGVRTCGIGSAIGAGGTTIATGFVNGGGVSNGPGNNETDGRDSFVGSGDLNLVASSGDGAFIGGGGTGLFMHNVTSYGNVTSGADSFIGAGDLNQISSTGNGSFIGGGGYAYVTGSATETTAGNQIFGVDSFIGAGDNNSIGGLESFIGGGSNNRVPKDYAVVAGGANNQSTGQSAIVGAGNENTAGGKFSAVVSGYANNVSGEGSEIGAGGANVFGSTIAGNDSFVGAGDQNAVNADEAFIGSGGDNTIGSAASYSSILGGNRNNVTAEYASILAGFGNAATGTYSIVAGGDGDTAGGTLSFAAGYHADAAHSGSFVWSDYSSGSTTVKDVAANQFVVRASGGTTIYSNEGATSGVSLSAGSGTWASLSDRAAKTDVVPLDDASILAKVSSLPISAWQYKTERGVRHVGPMAQDFFAAFGTGKDDRHITSIDEDGVALASVKAVNAKLDRDNARLRDDVARLRGANDRVQARLAALEASVAKLTSR